MPIAPVTDDGLVLVASGLQKAFGATVAVASADLEIRRGEVHGLVGANGAGKSTLVKMLAGAIKPDSGSIRIGELEGVSATPPRMQALGLATIHQEPMAAPDMRVAASLTLGREPSRFAFLSRRTETAIAHRALDRVGLTVSPDALLGDLTAAERQLVEIARALDSGARIILMDEPTAMLGAHESDHLLELIRELAASGVAILYISHHLHETLEITDRITVMRDGHTVETTDSNHRTVDDLITSMIGRDVHKTTPPPRASERPVLEVDIERSHRPHPVSFTLHAGEVLGITGLVGSGRSGIGRVLYGVEPFTGEMRLDGKPYRPRNPSAALDAGVGLLAEDRRTESLLTGMSVSDNISMLRPSTWLRLFLRRPAERAVARDWIARLGIRTSSTAETVANLSGGNQQKVALARWLYTEPKVLILDEPGQGVDIGATEDILRAVRDLALRGCAVLVISSDLEELTQVAHRVLVMREGAVAGVLESADVTEQAVLALAMGVESIPEASNVN